MLIFKRWIDLGLLIFNIFTVLILLINSCFALDLSGKIDDEPGIIEDVICDCSPHNASRPSSDDQIVVQEDINCSSVSYKYIIVDNKNKYIASCNTCSKGTRQIQSYTYSGCKCSTTYYYCDILGSPITSCNKGEYNFLGKCKTCPDGFSSNGLGDVINTCYRSCTADDVPGSTAADGNFYYGGFSNDCKATACISGYYLSNGTCTACDSGYTSPAGSTAATACTKSCSTKCTGSATSNCPANSTCAYNTNYTSPGIQNQTQTSCPATAVACPVSSFTCNNGYYKNGDACSICPVGSFCSGGTKTSCNSGYTTSSTGSTAATACTKSCSTKCTG
ncbi:MAG: hypothetical protein MJ187_04330, partial [Alphaproteobacteria bacterium]|nr:hypothetical protein [Alphaproteobacteria bacterium]